MRKQAAVVIALAVSLWILAGCSKDGVTGTVPDSGSQPLGLQSSDEPFSDVQTSGMDASGTDYSEIFVTDPHDWGSYDSLIAEIGTTTDFLRRATLMHQAEDMLMNTGAVLPVYYYNDVYMQKDYVSNVYSNSFGHKYFQFAGTNGDTLSLNLGGEPDCLDPALCDSMDSASLVVNSFAGLYTYDADGRVVPDLAAQEQVSEDGMTYTITLLPDLRWSDGSELDADDFVYAWNRVVAPETASVNSHLFDIVARKDDGSLDVAADEDARTLTIELNAPCAYFNQLLAFPASFPVKRSEAEGQSDWKTSPGAWAQEAGFATNGAYTLSAWTHGESMIYVRNPNYHRADEVEIGTLQFWLGEDTEAAFDAYQAGSLDFIDDVPEEEIWDLRDNGEFHIVDQPGTYYVCFNIDSPLFDGKTAAQASAMRRAFALLVDRGYVCDYVGRTGQKPANTFIPVGMADGNGGVFRGNNAGDTPGDGEDTGYFDPVWSQETVEEAISLLEFAGYRFENGRLSAQTPISFEYLTNNASGHIAIAEAIQQDFGEIGVDMTIRSLEQTAFLQERRDGNFDMARGAWFADFSDPVSMLEIWTTDSGDNVCRFGK